MAKLRIGISGWRYPPWRGKFYPKDLPQRLELHYASRQLDTIEINGSFYSLQRPDSWRSWYRDTPRGFVFAVKAPRFITHVRRLREVEKPLANFLASGVLELREKLGPMLWQFPPNLKYDAELFDAFLSLLPRDSEKAVLMARQHDGHIRHVGEVSTDRSAACATPLKCVTRVSTMQTSSACCAGIASDWWSPMPRRNGRSCRM